MLIKMKKRSKGFTLVELLLVVAILAVLAFLAVPAIAQTIKNARIRTDLANAKIVETNIWRWYADQVAKGVTFTIATPEVVALEDFEAQFTVSEGSPEADVLIDYFTPTQYPTCPFDADNTYDITYTCTTTELLSVSVVCSGAPH